MTKKKILKIRRKNKKKNKNYYILKLRRLNELVNSSTKKELIKYLKEQES